MKKRQHPFLEIPKEILQTGDLSKIINTGFTLPDRKFPPRFYIRNDNSLCCGYFVCYDKKVSTDQIFSHCQAGHWQSLSKLIGDFLIFYFDFANNELLVLADQFGKFPCFFSLEGKKLVISTDFETVKNKLDRLTLNPATALDIITRQMLPTNETVVSEIQQLPPATLLKINSKLSPSLEPLTDLNQFLALKQSPYASYEHFSNDCLLLLKQLTKERLNTLDNLKFGADISSGFDSPLVCYLLKELSNKPFFCYSGISKHATSDTNPEIVKDFAQKHDLKIKFIDEDPFYPFSSLNDLEWASKTPNQVAQELIYNFYRQIATDGNDIEFTGDGADEAYKAHLLDLLGPFPVQEEYFWTVQKIKLGLPRILTKEGIEVLLDKNRFSNKKVFPSIISSSAVQVNLGLYPICNETEIWPMTPFMDPRLIQFARRIPRTKAKAASKQEIWKTHKEIFIPSQFRSKQGPVGHVQLFIRKKQKFVISVLKNSLLAQKGWVRASDITNDIKSENYQKYLEGDTISFLLALLRLEYFLQQNNVRVAQ